MIKWGLLGGGTAMFGLRTFGADFVSPRTTPFVTELPLPPAPERVRPFRTMNCIPFASKSSTFYELVEEERWVRFHPELPLTPVWGYRDVNQPDWPFVPGPTFLARQNHGVVVRVHNRLPEDHRGFGHPYTSMHLHGGHTPSTSDGFPTDIFGPGEYYDYCYPLLEPGFSTAEADGGDIPSTIWYHDHLVDATGANVYRGLAGFFLVFHDHDPGDENNPAGLQLPSGPCDIPLVLQDRAFNRNGTLHYDTDGFDGFVGDKFLVNGVIQPYLRVKRRKYRFRLLNGSNARYYQMFLTKANGETFPFIQIGNEGGLFVEPLWDIRTFQCGQAERAEFVIDFRQFASGEEVFLENRLEQTDGRKPDDLTSRGTPLLKFVVEEEVPDPSQVAERLGFVSPISQADLDRAVRRTFELERTNGAWAINDRFFDPDRPLFTAQANTPQIYRIINKSGGWWHPLHIHLDFMRVLTRNGRMPPMSERASNAKKDTIVLRDNEEVEVFIRFRDYPGRYVLHCHNIEHEDLAMMARFDVV
jgi:FtsP/CotA-like multicopper oxidase with cupredoxin domain